MKLKTFLFDEDRGVSPVIGVILMVAITVILAAVIATFVLGLGEQISDTAPQASFDMQEDGSGDYELVHSGGEKLPDSGTYTWTSTGSGSTANSAPYTAGDPVVTGITDREGKLTWQEGDTSAVLYDGTN